MVDFQIGDEQKGYNIAIGSGFLFENRSLVDFQIGDEQNGRKIAGCK